jgi:hypothetical protein
MTSSPLPDETKPSFKEIMRLGQLAANTRVPSANQAKEIFALGTEMAELTVVPIFAQLLAHNIVPKAAIEEEVQRSRDHIFSWALACFAIGVEEGVGQVSRDVALSCATLVNRAFAAHLAYYLGKSMEAGILSQEDAFAQAKMILARVSSWGNRIVELGKHAHKTVKRQDTEFMQEVARIGNMGD